MLLGAAHRPIRALPAQKPRYGLRVGPLELDLIKRTAKRGDRAIDLVAREFRLLEYIMRREEHLLTRALLLQEVWNYKFVRRTNLVDVHMGRLRRKVDEPHELPMIQMCAAWVSSSVRRLISPVRLHFTGRCLPRRAFVLCTFGVVRLRL
jgi:DNA-binding response OmpR family regulator